MNCNQLWRVIALSDLYMYDSMFYWIIDQLKIPKYYKFDEGDLSSWWKNISIKQIIKLWNNNQGSLRLPKLRYVRLMIALEENSRRL
jgi:hypothetical protein